MEHQAQQIWVDALDQFHHRVLNDVVDHGQLCHLLGLEPFVLVAVGDIHCDGVIQHAVNPPTAGPAAGTAPA